MKKVVILIVLSLLLTLWGCTDSPASETPTESTVSLTPVDRLNRDTPHIDDSGRTVLDSSSRREPLPTEGIRKGASETEKKSLVQTDPEPTLGYIEDPEPITLPELPSGQETEAPLRAVGD